RAPEIALPPGLMVDTELTFYAGSGQLRADLGERFAQPVPIDAPPPGAGTIEAVRAFGAALKDDPWLDSWPVTLSGVIPIPAEDGWQLADEKGESALPIAPSALTRPGLWKLAALSGGGPVTVFGECGHRGFTPLAAWPEGSAETVTLVNA
ncbi:MAG TPA: SWIM zinc finger family protein, partial [Streptomyces sp.]|nr:SWIM zinc finger family protein [Streptomyces sp.]